MTLQPSAYMGSDDGHLVQALRDFAMRAPWDWQKLFLGLADRIEEENEDCAELSGDRDALGGKVEDLKERGTALVELVRGLEVVPDALEKACSEFEAAAEE